MCEKLAVISFPHYAALHFSELKSIKLKCSNITCHHWYVHDYRLVSRICTTHHPMKGWNQHTSTCLFQHILYLRLWSVTNTNITTQVTVVQYPVLYSTAKYQCCYTTYKVTGPQCLYFFTYHKCLINSFYMDLLVYTTVSVKTKLSVCTYSAAHTRKHWQIDH